MTISPQQDDMSRALAGIRSRLETLASITEANILIPGGPQERYHAVIEEAYAALGLVETQIDELRNELEYQHKRLDEIRDAQLAQGQQPALARPFDIYLKTLNALNQSGQLPGSEEQI